jgi:thioredoxin reductase (NADPH)
MFQTPSRYDCAIIGTGPAGLSAALTLKALNKTFLWFGSSKLSQKIRKAETISNYPGLSNVSGAEMAQSFSRQIADAGITITEKTVTTVCQMGDYYGILCDQEMFEATTIILATGVEAVKPIPGELELLGAGVSYCATCDGMLYRSKTIAVVSTSAEYEHEVSYLAELAEKVYFVPLYRDAAVAGENIVPLRKIPREILGKGRVEALQFDDETMPVDGVFFLKAAVSPSALVMGLETENGHVIVDRHCNTNLPGCFGAGDCTGRPYQYVKAAGEGNVAAHTVVHYLSEK